MTVLLSFARVIWSQLAGKCFKNATESINFGNRKISVLYLLKKDNGG